MIESLRQSNNVNSFIVLFTSTVIMIVVFLQIILMQLGGKNVFYSLLRFGNIFCKLCHYYSMSTVETLLRVTALFCSDKLLFFPEGLAKHYMSGLQHAL